MAAPNPVIVALPSTGEQPMTYPQLLDKLKCVCAGGAQIRPSPIPSATVNLGDIIADHARVLSVFASAYGMVAVVIQMIACIMEVLCSINNPFALIAAMIRLFGTCLPDFILLFPQLAIPAKIICALKVILAIIEYVLTVIIPLIQDLVQNLQELTDAISDQSPQAIAAISFKIVSLIKELYSILGILSVLSALFIMIKALIRAGIAIPCGGSGGACIGCGDDQCPSTLQQSNITGTDGVLTVLYGSDAFDYQMRFYSSSKKNDFLQIRDFFPKGMNYDEITDEDDLPYTIDINNVTYAIRYVDSLGSASITHIPQPFLADGYLSNMVGGATYTDPLDIRFATDTETFSSSFVNTRYIQIVERTSSAFAATNNGTWLIKQVYDGYNVRLHRDSGTWTYNSGMDPTAHIDWKTLPAMPSTGYNKTFDLSINHNELVRHGLIGVGCHPAIKAAATSLANRFPFAANLTLPTLPDFTKLLTDVDTCLAAVAPENVDTNYVIANITSISTGAAALPTCLTTILNNFGDSLSSYVGQIYPAIFSPENSEISADPLIQVVGESITVTVTPVDINGASLAQTLPQGIIDVEIYADVGDITTASEVLDVNGDSTGDFTAILTSSEPTTVKLSASVGGENIADFNGNTLVKREIEVQFVLPTPRRKIEGDIVEPLGSVSSE